MSSHITHIFKTFLHRLTNLTGNNRSLFLVKLSSGQLLDLKSLDFLTKGNSFAVVEGLIKGKSKVIAPVLDSRVASSNEISRQLKRIQRMDRFIYEERGSSDLHVGWPFVRGKFSDGTCVSAPLIFFPVWLEVVDGSWVLRLREDVGISFNKTFLLAHAFYNKVVLPEELLDTAFEDFDKDSIAWRTQLYELLKNKIEINFNPDNFRDELVPFTSYLKKDFDSQHQLGEIKLFPEALLGLFPQTGSQLVSDYQHLMEIDEYTSMEEYFLKHSMQDDSSSIKAIREENIYTPFAVDSWQENIIRKVKLGKSLVVQGPPGTGKSQLISNLIADAMATGKKVLMVCQKRAALDVVYKRLSNIGLADFLGLVHDFRNDRKDIYSRVARQILSIEDFKEKNRRVDIIQMERRFYQVCRRIDQIVDELEEYKFALFSEEDFGASIKELYLSSDLHAAVINMKQEFQHFTSNSIDDFLRKLKRYGNYAYRFEREDYLWRIRKSFGSLQVIDLKAKIQALEDIPIYQHELQQIIKKIIPLELTLEECEHLLIREDDMLGMLSVLKDEETYRYFQIMLMEKDEETSLLWFSNMERVFLNCYDGDGPEVSLPQADLGRLQMALKQRMDARRSLTRRLRWEFFSEDRYWLKRILVANGLEYNKNGFIRLERKLDNRLNLEHHLTALKAKSWLVDMPEDYEVKVFKVWFERKKYAIRAKVIFRTLREINDTINPQKLAREEFIQTFHSLVSAVEEIPIKKMEWKNHLSVHQIRRVIHEPDVVPELVMILKRDFEDLCAYDQLMEGLTDFEAAVIQRLHDHTKDWDYAVHSELFKNSLFLAWIDYIESKYPILRMASSMKMEELTTELRELVKEKSQLSTDIMLLRAQERVTEDLEYNRLNNRVTYRDLLHQASKKKKIWPLRKLIAEMHEELFRVIPCWMASPESVSAIFPMREIFDLVIFDEASQCFSERAIPAIFRGKQILIAGDSKQLQPTELYRIRWEGDDEDPDNEIDSLLDLGERYLPNEYLRGHYRSQAPELIDFSNRHFYEGKLQLLPDFNFVNEKRANIQYVKVSGVWKNNCNEIEATTVVDWVFNFLKNHPDKEIGVVTFNAPQQMLIMDLLEEESIKRDIPIPSTLMVKNIENVQGDEKDLIIFSIGYASDESGKLNMQFGSLNVQGGENRLNVAITRARESIVVIASIWPEELKVSEAKNVGPKLLKEYLQFARQVQEEGFILYEKDQLQKPSNWYVKQKIKAWGEERIHGVEWKINALPFSDLSLVRKDSYVGAVLTDDDRYYSSLSIKDAHAYTVSLLRKKHWKYRIIHSRNFWCNKEQVEESLIRLVGEQPEEGGLNPQS